MQLASAVSPLESASTAVSEVTATIVDRLGADAQPDLVVAFTSAHTPDAAEEIAAALRGVWPGATLLGATTEGTIADGTEIERDHSLAVFAGVMPGVTIRPFRLTAEDMVTVADWHECLGVGVDEEPTFITTGDPFSFDVNALLDALNEAYPGRPVLGGMASGAWEPGGNRLMLDGAIHTDGMIGVALSGNIAVDTVVSQGCRPIGRRCVITKGQENVVFELASRPALEVLNDMAQELPPTDQKLLENGLFLGRAIDEYRSEFGRGDFLVLNVLGIDPESGAMAVGGEIRRGATVQFHVRDAASADDDLREMLAPFAPSGNGAGGTAHPPYAGALLFSCNGRGTRMWDTPGHDVTTLHDMFGELPVIGFFAAGELGPIAQKNFIHGFTASVGLLRPKH